MKLILSVDSGTQSTRCCVYDADTLIKVAASQKYSHPLITPHEGWSEHIVEDIEKAVVDSMVNALARFSENEHSVVGIGITNQRETIVAWDKSTGLLLSDRTICWNDGRTGAEVSKLLDDVTKEQRRIIRKTGLKLNAYYSASKMKWFIDNIEAVAEADKKGTLLFGTIDSYIIYRLSNNIEHVTDVTNASRTLLFDIYKLCWQKDLCNFWKISIDSLPNVKPSSSTLCTLPSDFSEYKNEIYRSLPPILRGIRVTGCIGDQQAATIGHNLFTPGQAKITFGSGGFMLMNCGREVPKKVPRGCTISPLVCMEREDGNDLMYCVEGSIAIAGMGITWLEKNNLLDLKELESVIYKTPSSEGMVFIPAFSGLLSPWWDDEVRGTILGMSLKTGKSHMVRAFLESLAIQVDEILKDMRRTGNSANTIYMDGGLSQSDAFLQLVADFTGVPLHRPPDCEMTVRGAAICSLIGSGYQTFEGIKALAKTWDVGVKVMSQKYEPAVNSKTLESIKAVKKKWLLCLQHIQEIDLN